MKGISFFKCFVVLVLAINLFSCNQDADIDDNTLQANDENIYIELSFPKENGDLKTKSILPTPLDKRELSYVLKGKQSNMSIYTEYGSWDTWDEMNSMTKISLPSTGAWSFTLNASKNGILVLTDTISQTINYGCNSLSFNLKEVSTGNGSLDVSLEYPQTGIAKVTAGLFTLEGNAVTGFSMQNLSSTNTNGFKVARYNKPTVPAGNYILRFYLYQKTSDATFSNCFSALVHIAPGCITTGTERIEDVNLVFQIEYELNGGDWLDDSYIPLSYTNYSSVELPKQLYKLGFVFAGWYENEDFSSQRVYSIPLKTNGNKKYYAKWIDKIVCTSSEFVTAFEGLTGNLEAKITDTNPNMNSIRSGLAKTNVKIKLDLSSCTGLSSIPSGIFTDMANITEIILPSSCTSISDYAFKNSGLEKINVPSTVYTIGQGAFSNCKKASLLTLSDGVQEIGYGAFENCTAITSADIPDSVITIGDNLFKGCIALESVSIGSSISRVSSCMFSGCKNLIDITLGSGVEEIADRAFENCTKISQIIFPESLSSIGSYAFSGCSSIESFVFSENLMSIGSYAFKDCTSIREIAIPNSVYELGDRFLYGCKDIFIIVNNALLNTYATTSQDSSLKNKKLEGLTNYTISVVCGDDSLADNIFYNETELKQVTLSAGIKNIGSKVFYGCSNLSGIILPTDLKEIGDYAFYNCSKLAELNLPATITDIGNYLLSGCSKLSSLNLPQNIKTIGNGAFERCTGISTFIIPDGVTSIGEGVFNGLQNCSITIKSSLLSPYAASSSTYSSHINKFFEGCTGFTVILSSASSVVGDYLFCNVSELNSIVIPSSVQSIGDYAFYYCSGLSNIIDIPSTCASIGMSAFEGSGITSVLIPSGVANINQSCFKSCVSLTTVVLPETVTEIKKSAFEGCSNLSQINMPLNLTIIGESAFKSCASIPSLVIPGNNTEIGNYAFQGCLGLISVDLQDGIKSIGEKAFEGSGLTSVCIPASLTNAGSGIFMNCTSLQSMSTAEGLRYIAESMFYKCSALTNIELTDSVVLIRSNAFCGCESLSSVVLPNVRVIETYAFFNCKNLISVKNMSVFDYAKAFRKDVNTGYTSYQILPYSKIDNKWKTSSDYSYISQNNFFKFDEFLLSEDCIEYVNNLFNDTSYGVYSNGISISPPAVDVKNNIKIYTSYGTDFVFFINAKT